MQAATRRNLALAALGIAFLFLLWQVPGRQAKSSLVLSGLGTPHPTPTAETHWRPLLKIEGSGNRDLCAEQQWITVPGPWRLRAEPADKAVEVRVLDQHSSELFARVWAAGEGHGTTLATLPQGNGTYCLQIEAAAPYTLYVEAWEAPQN